MAAAHVSWFDRSKQTRRKDAQVQPQGGGVPTGRSGGALTVFRTPGVGTTTRFGTARTKLTVDARVAEAAWTALDAITVLSAHAADVAGRFRAGDLAHARRGLLQLMQGTEVLVAIAAMTTQLAGLDARTSGPRRGERAEDRTALAIDALIAAEFEDDWTTVALTLEGSFVRALGAWRTQFETLLGLPAGPGPGPSAA